MINGQALSVPTNWKGYDQANRDDFFGMIEIDVPAESVQASNTVSLTFPDSDGHLSSLVLITENDDPTVLSLEKSALIKRADKLLLYPNPVDDVLYLEEKYQCKAISFFTLTGKEIFSTIYDGNAVDVTHLASGLYLVRLEGLYAKLLIE